MQVIKGARVMDYITLGAKVASGIVAGGGGGGGGGGVRHISFQTVKGFIITPPPPPTPR